MTFRSKVKPDESELVASARMGDERAFSLLAESYRRVLDWHIRHLDAPDSMYDDLFQEGLLGLFRAVRSYDGKSSSFSTFASFCIKNSIISAVRRYSKQDIRTVPLPDSTGIEHSVPSVEQQILDEERASVLYDRVFSALSDYEKQVFELYLSDLSHDSIAFITGKSVRSTSNAIYRIRQKLKKLVTTA